MEDYTLKKRRKKYIKPRLSLKQLGSKMNSRNGFKDFNEEMGIFLADVVYPGR